MDDLLNDENAILDLDKIMKRINSDGTTLSVDDILWREKYILSDSKMEETQPVELSEDAKPVIVTNIRSSCEDTSNPLLDDLTRELNHPYSPMNDIVLIHDVLDEESHEQEDTMDMELRQALSQHQAIVQYPSDVQITESTHSPSHDASLLSSPTVHSSPPPSIPSTSSSFINTSSHSSNSNASPLHSSISDTSHSLTSNGSHSPLLSPSLHSSIPNLSPSQSSTESRRENSCSSRTLRLNRDVSVRSAKENIVCSDPVIHEPSISA